MAAFEQITQQFIETKTDENNRRFCFDLKNEQKEKIDVDNFPNDTAKATHILQHFKEFYVNINDVVTEQDDEKIYEKMRKLVSNFIHSRKFEIFMVILICLNAFQTRLRNFDISYTIVLAIIEQFFIGILIVEMLAKWYCGFLLFWTDYWNIADFFIIAISQIQSWAFFSKIAIIRVIKLIRKYGMLKINQPISQKGFSLVIETLVKSIKDVGNIAVLMFILSVVLSIIGVHLFSDEFSDDFGNPLSAMYTIFVCITQEGWLDIFRKFENDGVDTFTYAAAVIFFIFVILLAAFVIMNLIVAVLTINLERLMRQRKVTIELTNKKEAENNFYLNKIDPINKKIIYLDKILSDATSKAKKYKLENKGQIALCKIKLFKTKIYTYENYCMLVAALKKNVEERNIILLKVRDISQKIKEINIKSEK